MNDSRHKILSAIKEATAIPSQLPGKPQQTDSKIAEGLKSVTPAGEDGLLEQFRSELEKVSGEFHVVKSSAEIALTVNRVLRENDYKSLAIAGAGIQAEVAQLALNSNPELTLFDVEPLDFKERRDKLAKTATAIVKADYAVSDIASLAIIYEDTPSTLLNFLPDCIFAIVNASNLLANQFELFDKIPAEKAKDMVLVTGASRTADIEKILVLGAHGPKRLIVFMMEN